MPHRGNLQARSNAYQGGTRARLRHFAAAPIAVPAAVLSVPAAVSAANASPAPWQPYRTTPWTEAPRRVRRFGVATTIMVYQEQYRTLASYPDGSPKVQEFRGPPVVRHTNTSTSESVVRDLSSYGWFRYGADGEPARSRQPCGPASGHHAAVHRAPGPFPAAHPPARHPR